MARYVSSTEIEAAKTANGGWTREQLEQWGVPWPPPKGWRMALEGGDPIPKVRPVQTARGDKRNHNNLSPSYPSHIDTPATEGEGT